MNRILRDAIRAAGLSYEQVVAEVGVDEEALLRAILGLRLTLPGDQAQKLAARLQTTPEALGLVVRPKPVRENGRFVKKADPQDAPAAPAQIAAPAHEEQPVA